MAVVVITGSAGGIGDATRAVLEADGHRVLGVDVRDAEIIADLSTGAGRDQMIEQVGAASGGAIDGVVAGAGLLGADPATIVSVNYFGAIATLRGLRPMLTRGEAPSAIAISSNSATTQPGLPAAVVAACLAGDEDAARAAAGGDSVGTYAATKLALARWVRRQAVTAEWAGAGVRLNAVAPGLVATPMTADGIDFVLSLGDVYPLPQQRAAAASEVAGLLRYLLSPDAAFFCGSVVFMDGGSDAAVHPDDWPAAR